EQDQENPSSYGDLAKQMIARKTSPECSSISDPPYDVDSVKYHLNMSYEEWLE
nr:hypothetical protein [Tanacetum cinerariifolium]